MKLIKACIAMAAFAALFVVPSVASALPELTHPTGTRAPVGTLITATNVEHTGTSKILKMTIPGFEQPVECATATLTGELTSNTGNHIAGNITTAEFYGKPGEATHGVHCTGPLGNVTVTPSHSTNPCHTPTGGSAHCSLPWCVTATGEKTEFTVRGGKCSEAARPITFTLHTALLGACSYQKASVTGTFTRHPADAIMTITNQNFTRLTTTGSAFCPGEGALDMAFTLGTDPDDTKPLYIDAP